VCHSLSCCVVGCQSELQSLFSSSKAFCIQESSDIEKIALVFGNSNYKLEDLNIPTAANDAEAIANKLKSLGWRVRCHQNSTLAIMKKHMLSFYDACNRNQQITAAVLFYAGHAVQVSTHKCDIVSKYHVKSSSILVL
jgi:uncharacterized caspase-like protein